MHKLVRKKDSFFNEIIVNGIKEGIRGSLNFIKIMLPISLSISILKYFGVIKLLSDVVSPIFKLIGLRGEAVIALISGYLVNCYSAIAVMSTLNLSNKEITILAVMLVLCHTLPVELSIQKKAGGSFFLIMFIRIFSSLMMGFIFNWIIPNDTGFTNLKLQEDVINDSAPFLNLIISWLFENVVVINMIAINIILTIFYNILKRYRLTEKISSVFKYIMFMFGLPKETAFLWIVTNIIGLIYGATMLVEEKNNNTLDETSFKKLNISIATCHSIIQETANFVVIGASAVYLIIPRIAISIISVWIYNLVLILKNSRIGLQEYKNS